MFDQPLAERRSVGVTLARGTLRECDRRRWLPAVVIGVAASLFGCGGGAPDADATRVQAEAARTYAAELGRCFASDVSARVVVASDGTLTLGESCALLPAMERRDIDTSFAADHAELLLDPSMTGVEFIPVAVNDPSDGSGRIDVALRYFRSNGAPYEFTATLAFYG